MRNILLLCLLTISIQSNGQILTLITTLTDGSKDTVKFGFVDGATQGEDASLGEMNVFMTPTNGYEGRILQRDSSNFSCAMELDRTRIYYPENFDTKVNYRDRLDTTLQNRLFEVWYSDGQTDSMEMICDIPFSSFLNGALLYSIDCIWDPPVGILVIQDDTLKHIKFKMQLGLGVKQINFITNPEINTTSLAKGKPIKETIEINIFPNPTNDKICINSNRLEEIEDVVIYTSIGGVVDHFKSMPINAEIDISEYANGIYMIVLVLKNGEHLIKRIIKQ